MLRRQLGRPDRCDNEACKFFSEPLIWNGKPVKPILDHINGNSKDSSESNLRYLCPNCDSQLKTRGGGNRGRVLEATEENKYVLKKDDGFRDTHLIMPVARLSIATVEMTVNPKKETSAA
jgi:transposase-like protein